MRKNPNHTMERMPGPLQIIQYSPADSVPQFLSTTYVPTFKVGVSFISHPFTILLNTRSYETSCRFGNLENFDGLGIF